MTVHLINLRSDVLLHLTPFNFGYVRSLFMSNRPLFFFLFFFSFFFFLFLLSFFLVFVLFSVCFVLLYCFCFVGIPRTQKAIFLFMHLF